MKYQCLLTLTAGLFAGSSAIEVVRHAKQPLSASEKRSVGASLTKALNAMANHAGGSKWEACAGMYPNGQPPADAATSATWQSCKSEFMSYAAAALLQQPLSGADKRAVGQALTKALNSISNHAGGSKWEACTGMFPNGQPPSDAATSATWQSCKSEFLVYAASSLVQQPLSSRDKQAVGQALNKALSAMSNHAGGSKHEACADMFPGGKPPADAATSATWYSCKSEFLAYASAALVQSKGKKASLLGGSSSLRRPLSGADKQAVGQALNKALSAMTNHAGGSKFAACSDMFPNGQPPADAATSATWQSCKSEFLAYAAAALLQQPLSSSEKQQVGAALNKALGALQGHGGGSKYQACADMYPEGKPPADQNNPTWKACKDQFSLVGTQSVIHHSSAMRALPLAALAVAAFFL